MAQGSNGMHGFGFQKSFVDNLTIYGILKCRNTPTQAERVNLGGSNGNRSALGHGV